MLERFNAPAQQGVARAVEETRRLGGAELSATHLLMGLLQAPDAKASGVLRDLGVSPGELYQRAVASLGPAARSGDEVRFSSDAKAVLLAAATEATRLGSHEIRPEHVLLGLASVDAAGFLEAAGVSVRRARAAVQLVSGLGLAPRTGKGENLFELFNDHARRAVILCQEAVRGLKHDYIGTEHLLLGVVDEGQGLASKLIELRGATTAGIRRQIEERVKRGAGTPERHLPFTPQASECFVVAVREALLLGHSYVGTEHLLLGLLRQKNEIVATQVLLMNGLTFEWVRQEVINQLTPRVIQPTSQPTLESLDEEITDILAEADKAADRGDWIVVGLLRERERDLLAQWARLSRTQEQARKQQPPDESGRLPAPAGSTVVLIGASEFDDPGLPNLPAVEANLADLAGVLGDPRIGGFHPSRIHILVNPAMTVADRLAEIASDTTDTLFVYYSGHGVVGADGGLYLALSQTVAQRAVFSSLAYQSLRLALIGSPARSKVVVLDCCFAGRAIDDLMTDEDNLAVGQIDVDGTYVLTATSATSPAHIEPGARNSAFTGALLELLRTGSPAVGELLRLNHLYPWLLRALTERGLPVPQQRGSGTIGDLALTRNPHWL